jgi:hypothetical protein
VSILSAGQSGIFAQATNASFNGATISSSAVNGVTLAAAGGETTTFLIANSKINGAGGSGVNIVGSGGDINATVQTNGIAVTGSSISATNNGAGTVSLTALGNAGVTTAAPAGSIVLSNASTGVFNVVQSGTTNAELQTAIGSSNNGATVSILSAEGTITPDAPPTPIP